MKRSLSVTSVLLGAALCLSAPAHAALTDEPGPALTTPVATLDRALECSTDLRGVTRDPVLLTPAFSSAAESYGWGYRRALPAEGIPTCSLTLPDRGYGDLQVAAEYVVRAVRKMSAESGRKVALLGHQHGALDGLWALRFWPDIAGRVSDFVSLATPYKGTVLALGCLAVRVCPPSAWQISAGSRFLRAATGGPLPAGPSYTSITTLFDELIVPQPSVSRLDGAANIVLQDVCPLRPIEHFTILADALAYDLALDALAHPGPADPARIPPKTCSGPLYLPGVLDLTNIPKVAASAAAALAGAFVNVPLTGLPSVLGEPVLKPYAQRANQKVTGS